jgi:hypothetical protein
VAREHLAGAPQLVPVYSHRFLPAGRGTYGHPVLSVMQTDIVCYGSDLLDYVQHEFGGPETVRADARCEAPATVGFWRDLVV